MLMNSICAAVAMPVARNSPKASLTAARSSPTIERTKRQRGPAHVPISDAAVLADLVLARRKNASFDRLVQPRSPALLKKLRIIQPADEQEVGDLLDHL
jgi:hypothetical protein